MSSAISEAQERLKRLSGYLEKDPKNGRLLVEVGELALSLGDAQTARNALKQAESLNPDDPQVSFQLASVALFEGKFQEAESKLMDLLDRNVSHPAVRYNLAFARLHSGNFKGVVECLNRMPEEELDSVPKARFLLARALHRTGELPEARNHLERYLVAAPDDAEAQGALALLCFDLDDNSKAKEIAADTLKSDSQNLEALLTLGGLAIAEQDPDAAKRHLETVVKLAPEAGRAWSTLAYAEMLNLDFKTARGYFEKAVQYMPDHIGTWHGLAWLQILEGEYPGARASMQKAMDIDRNFAETHGTLAVISVLEGKAEEAKPHIRRALGLNPESFAARFAQSQLAAASGDKDKSAALLTAMTGSLAFSRGRNLQQMVATLVARKQPAVPAPKPKGKK